MTRLAVLRSGYAAFGLSILALAGSFVPALGWLILLSALVAVAGAILLVFSDDDIPRWAGIAFLAYAALTFVVFVAATPATIRFSFWNGFVNSEPHALWSALQAYLLLALPLMTAATALVAAWEREHGARILLAGAVAGILMVGVLTVVLSPDAPEEGGSGSDADLARAQSEAASQGRLLNTLLALSAGAGAAGAVWAAARPDEFH